MQIKNHTAVVSGSVAEREGQRMWKPLDGSPTASLFPGLLAWPLQLGFPLGASTRITFPGTFCIYVLCSLAGLIGAACF